MAKVIKCIGLLLVPALFFIVACSQPAEPTSTQPTQPVLKKITLDDSPTVLDLLPLLPTSFERLDAASEGMSNSDMGLGSDFSEVEVILNEDPYQLIFAYLAILEEDDEVSRYEFIQPFQLFPKLEKVQRGASGKLGPKYLYENHPDLFWKDMLFPSLC